MCAHASGDMIKSIRGRYKITLKKVEILESQLNTMQFIYFNNNIQLLYFCVLIFQVVQ